jgi:hypothetical protein
MMNAYGLEQIVKEKTHNEGHTLDHIYVNECQMELNYEVGDKNGISTDHFKITFQLPQMEEKAVAKTVTFRNKREMDIEGLRKELKEALEEIRFDDDEKFETKYSQYRTASEAIIDKYAPIVTKTVREKAKIPWMDGEFKSNRRKRRQLEKKWRKDKNEENRTNYINQRNLCADMSISKQN